MQKFKIISGGQTGADLAGLWAANLYGVPTGGRAPKGWRTQLGPKPELGEFFDLTESRESYHGRTLENCESSDLTVIFASNIKSPGSKLTLHHCVTNGIRYKVFPFSEGSDVQHYVDLFAPFLLTTIKQHLSLHGSMTLNVAGNSTSTSAPTFTITFLTMCQVLDQLLGKTPDFLKKYSVKKVESLLRDSYERSSYEMIHNIIRSEN